MRFILLLYMLFLLCLIPIIIIHTINKINTLNKRRKTRLYEIPCDDVSLSVPEDLRMIDDVIDVKTDVFGRSICVFDNLTYIVDSAAERRHRQRLAKGFGQRYLLSCGNEIFAPKKRPYTTFVAGLGNTTDDGYRTILKWKSHGNTSFIGESFVFNGDRIRVNTTSFFYIHYMLTFRQGLNTGENNTQVDTSIKLGPKLVFVSLRRRQSAYNTSMATTLLRNRYPVCTDRCADKSTVHMGSHFLLHRGDELFLQVSDLSSVDQESNGNVFGMYKLE